MFYLNSTLNFGIPPVLVFQLEVYYKVDRLLTGLTAQQKGTTSQWYTNKTSLSINNKWCCMLKIDPNIVTQLTASHCTALFSTIHYFILIPP